MARDGKLRLGIGIQGGGGHWRDPAIAPDAASDIRSYIDYAKLGEEGKFDFAFIADSAYITQDSTWHFISRLEPLAALAAVSSVTRHIGLLGTFSTSYSWPFTTARQIATLDRISNGRAAWNAVTSALEGVARNYNGEKLHDHALRYRIAHEYIEVVKGLWDSFEPGAFVRDKESGVYVDWDRIHTLDHKGEFFQVQGPLNIEPSPQGRPVIFQAGASPEGRDLAARHADAIFAGFAESHDLEFGKAYYKDIKSRAVSYGRSPDDILILPSIGPIVGETQAEAEAKYGREVSWIDPDYAVKYLSRYFSFFDFSRFPLDEPLPGDLGDIGANSFKSTAEYYLRIAKEENLTLRQLAYRAASPRGNHVGTAEHIADKIEQAFVEKAVDGYIVGGTLAHMREFNRLVLPELRRRGLFRTEYESTTLRGNLGLSFPENRYAAARRQEGLQSA